MSESKTYTKADYRSDLKPVWCPGCGDYAVLTALHAAFSALQIPPHKLVLISGIGCSGRLPGYCATYGINAIHGRALPIATGVKAARPDLTVLAMGGDGDIFSIGGGHLVHAARRNIDIALIVMDNNIYGLTKGQSSPTTPAGEKTATAIYGWPEEPMRPVNLALAYGVSFVAQTHSGDVRGMANLMAEAIKWPGFAFVEILSPCVTWRGRLQYDVIRKRARPIPPEHDVTDRAAAFALADDPDHYYMGIYFKVRRPTFEERFSQVRRTARENTDGSSETLLNRFRT